MQTKTNTTVTKQIGRNSHHFNITRVLYSNMCLEGHTYPVPANTVSSAMFSTLFVVQCRTCHCSKDSNLLSESVKPVKTENRLKSSRGIN